MNIRLGNNLKTKLSFWRKALIRRLSNTTVNSSFGKNEGITAIYVINLDRQPNRYQEIAKELKLQKMSIGGTLADISYRIPAIDGKQLDVKCIPTELINKEYHIKDQYFVDPDPRLLAAIKERDIPIEMSSAEIAVALSHIKAWHKMVSEEVPYALIVEDDIFFERYFAATVNQLWEELPKSEGKMPDFDLLYLSYKEVERRAEIVPVSKSLIRPIRGFWWFSGYVLSLNGAKRLLSFLPVVGPIDLWINLVFKKLDVYAASSSVIYQRDDLKSNNQYSILPVLSQIGVQSDKTHLELQQRKGRNPVFVFTNDIRQAAIFETALSVLGYSCCFDRWNDYSKTIHRFVDSREPLLFDAYIHINSLSSRYKELSVLYPDAVFILLDNIDVNQKQTAAIEDESKQIIKHFTSEKNKLLVIRANRSVDWTVLCNFLHCEVPPFEFPVTDKLPTVTEYERSSQQPNLLFSKNTVYLEHDVTPWILPIERAEAYGVSYPTPIAVTEAKDFEEILKDNFETFNIAHWRLLEDSFPSNLAYFTSENFGLRKPSGFNLTLSNRNAHSRKYTSASIMSLHKYLYGSFEIVMRPVKMSGVITAFFLHRNDPWQELDFEFLGKDTTKALINVYFNPGTEQSGWNFGNRGTPVLVDLGFDAAADFHKYTIEWEPHEVRWSVDGKLIHVRSVWKPTPIPNLGMNLFVNLWPSRSEELAGSFNGTTLPIDAEVLSIAIRSW